VTLRRAFKSEAERTSAEQRAPWALSLSQRVRGAEVDTVSAAAAGAPALASQVRPAYKARDSRACHAPQTVVTLKPD